MDGREISSISEKYKRISPITNFQYPIFWCSYTTLKMLASGYSFYGGPSLMKTNIYTIGGISSFVYVSVTFLSYMYLWIRFGSVLRNGQVNQILPMIDRNSIEWPIVWWTITIIPHAFIPLFLAVLRGLWKDEATLASMALMAGIVALILGILSPLRCIAISEVLARIFVTGNEMQKAASEVIYKIEESYGKGMYCVFGAT